MLHLEGCIIHPTDSAKARARFRALTTQLNAHARSAEEMFTHAYQGNLFEECLFEMGELERFDGKSAGDAVSKKGDLVELKTTREVRVSVERLFSAIRKSVIEKGTRSKYLVLAHTCWHDGDIEKITILRVGLIRPHGQKVFREVNGVLTQVTIGTENG